jgi:hypothetical protein
VDLGLLGLTAVDQGKAGSAGGDSSDAIRRVELDIMKVIGEQATGVKVDATTPVS